MSCLNLKNAMLVIKLTPTDAELFRAFQQHYQTFNLLVDKGVFDCKNATILLDFDSRGVLQTVRRNDILFSRRHEME